MTSARQPKIKEFNNPISIPPYGVPINKDPDALGKFIIVLYRPRPNIRYPIDLNFTTFSFLNGLFCFILINSFLNKYIIYKNIAVLIILLIIARYVFSTAYSPLKIKYIKKMLNRAVPQNINNKNFSKKFVKLFLFSTIYFLL